MQCRLLRRSDAGAWSAFLLPTRCGRRAVANCQSNNVSILKNNGNGNFVSRIDYDTGWGPYSVMFGDVNDDGFVTNVDYAVARRLTLGIFQWEDYDVDNMDVNRDGQLNNSDWAYIRRYVLNISGFENLPNQ